VRYVSCIRLDTEEIQIGSNLNISGDSARALVNLLGCILILILCVRKAGAADVHVVQHVVIFMQENRSFDHYFGSLKGVNGFGDRAPLTFTNGQADFYQPVSGQAVLPYPVTSQCLSDLDHGWSKTHDAWHGG
jgi:phospholipase C